MGKKLDTRLMTVAQQIRSKTHADIGSDHGGLLVWLIQSGRVEFGIAIDDKQVPFENSIRALKNLPSDVRLGDGLNALEKGEADSLSICGLGAEKISDILLAHPDRIPPRVVLQVFHKPEILRRWAMDHGFHLQNDQTTDGERAYTVLTFERPVDPAQRDPAYDGVDLESALLFGPFVLKREDRQFDHKLKNEEVWWRNHQQLSPKPAQRLKLLRSVMADRGIKPLP